jgi:thiol-disulfide isomerase/thioredoxin
MKKKLLILVLLFGVITSSKAQNVGVDVGDIAPEIDLPDAKGNNVALSSLRGGLVLIDFWASWCGPCIKEQPELLKLYNTYPEKLGIYGVSLDTKKLAWTGTVAKFKLPWTQVSDLKYWSSPVVSSYMIQALPLNFLIDKNGVILAKNIHGTALNDFVKSQLGQ